ncbi:ABC-2 type transport system permease protein [Actinopolyspora saharensis]|uniref:ABC-2 type transport system permease protein n=2 Tax=Actinopolyspora saharensis TaxID=995062 RepID=A0A1H0YAF4_9ACTN|nr:ABC transporter permease [Actinopolyspora saharensis]SDQ12082.1 ABC-2 type transport system permease protein [Actinopolyspora saharensis]
MTRESLGYQGESSATELRAGRDSPKFPPGTFHPSPGRASPPRMLVAQTRTETLLTLRHPEQALLTLLIPLVLLIGLSELDMGIVAQPRVDSVTPRILALAVMSTAFTGQAIALGFDRRYGVIKRLTATALPRWVLIAGRVLAALLVVALQTLVLSGTAVALGWTPSITGALLAVPVLALGTLAFGAGGVLIGGALRAEIVLAVANTVWFLLLMAGGLAVPARHLPTTMTVIADYLPSGALAEALSACFAADGAFPLRSLLVLLGWGLAAGALAVRTTRAA